MAPLHYALDHTGYINIDGYPIPASRTPAHIVEKLRPVVDAALAQRFATLTEATEYLLDVDDLVTDVEPDDRTETALFWHAPKFRIVTVTSTGWRTAVDVAGPTPQNWRRIDDDDDLPVDPFAAKEDARDAAADDYIHDCHPSGPCYC